MRRRLFFFFASMLMLLSVLSCETLNTATGVAASAGAAAGVLTENEAGAITRSASAIAKSFEDFTPEQEYYIGRSVAAVILSNYPPDSNDALNSYVNRVGQSVASFSDRPEIFNGYHFMVLNSNEINAFATPGGHIFITKGLIRCCRTEDALAAVLAHEIGHIERKHGLQSIKKARLSQAFAIIAMEGTKAFGPAELTRLTDTFGDSINDITTTLITNGYSRSFEYEADQVSAAILKRIGYNPAALIDMLQVMETTLKPENRDFAKTHPSPRNRINSLEQAGLRASSLFPPAQRQARFQKAMLNL